MSLITQTPNYSIANGNKNFDAVQIEGHNAFIQVNYVNIVASNVTLELEQAVAPGANFDAIAGSLQTVNPAKASHSWNITGIAKGIYLRVVAKKGSAAAGTISSINFLI